jgi:O-antigen ligase
LSDAIQCHAPIFVQARWEFILIYVPQPLPQTSAARTDATWLSHALLSALAAMFALPFMWPRHTMPIPSLYAEAVAAFVLLLAALLAVLVAGSEGHRDEPRRIPRVALIFSPLIAVLCLQLVLGKFSFAYNGLFPLMVIAAAIAATVLGASCARWYGHEKLLTWFCCALLLGACWNVVAQFVQLTKSWQFTTFFSYSLGSLYGNLAQRNHLSTYLCWALVGALYLFAKGRLSLSALLALLTVFLVGLVLTASRMSWLQICWIAGAGGYLVTRMDAASRPRHWRALFALPLAMALMTVVLPYLIDFLQLGFSETAFDRLKIQALDHNRWLIYSQAWEIFKAHPWIGIGPGELQFNQLLLMDHYKAVLFASSAHNLLLDLLVMTGVPGTLGFAWFGIAWFLRIRRHAVSLERIAILLMLAVLGIHSLLEFPEWYGFFLFPTAFLMGSLETRFIAFKANLATRTLPLTAAMYGIVCCAVLWYQYRQVETLYYDHYVRNPGAKAGSVEVLAKLYEYRAHHFFDAPADFILAWNLQLNPHALDQKLVFSEHAIRFQPGANVLYRHIILLGLAKRESEALIYLKRLQASFPSDFEAIAGKLIEAGKQQPELFGRIAAKARALLQESINNETTEG